MLLPDALRGDFMRMVSTGGVKKSLEFDYPPPMVAAFRRIHGFATVISTACSGITLKT